jgi:hypothetical protein
MSLAAHILRRLTTREQVFPQVSRLQLEEDRHGNHDTAPCGGRTGDDHDGTLVLKDVGRKIRPAPVEFGV